MPIRVVDSSHKHEKEKLDHMVSLVERMLKLHERLAKATRPDDKNRLQRQIAATDHEIDKLVYDLPKDAYRIKTFPNGWPSLSWPSTTRFSRALPIRSALTPNGSAFATSAWPDICIPIGPVVSAM